jgi:hypothetical protein
MIKVYFQTVTAQHTELVAVFQDEDMYNKCLPILQQEADKQRCIITESVHPEDIREELGKVSELEHRLAMVADDIKAIREFIMNSQVTLMENSSIKSRPLGYVFNRPTPHADDCWTHIINIEIACDLNSPESLTWTKFRS